MKNYQLIHLLAFVIIYLVTIEINVQ